MNGAGQPEYVVVVHQDSSFTQLPWRSRLPPHEGRGLLSGASHATPGERREGGKKGRNERRDGTSYRQSLQYQNLIFCYFHQSVES